MSKILRFLTCLFCIVFIGDAVFAAGYECPTYRQYTTCNPGYYLAYSYSGTSGSNLRYYSTPRAGNACRPCRDYDTYRNKPEGSYYCEGKTKAPVLNIVTITYNLNGGSGTKPANVSCKKGQTCTLDDGATTMFYRAGYVFKGWALTRTATSGFTSYTFNANDTVYAVWEKCGIGKYKPGSGTQAAAACSSCPDFPTGFAYASITGLKKKTECLAAAANVGLLNENCRDEITSAPVRLVVGAEDDTDWTLYYTVPTTTSMIRANPGAYVNPEILTDGTWQPYSNFNADELCKLCQAGTYNGDMSQTVTSCTACPTGYDDNPETGLTSADMCQISCPGGYYLAAANDATCSEVSPGYWAAEKIVNYGDTSTRTECASGLTTIGRGAGADEATDCGRVLHFGDDTLYLRSAKKTDHALHVGINGDVFYGNMGTDLSKGSLRIKLGDTTYSVYDDSM